METGIFFDLDGTLWDSAKNVAKSWTKTLKSLNYDITITEADMHSVMGKLMKEIAEILFSGVPEEKRAEVLAICEKEENELIKKEGGRLFPDVENVLKELSQKYKLFIISNCQQGYIEAFLEYYGFGKYITDTENPGVTGLPKGENIKLVAKRNDIDNIIYVGDTNGDYQATKIAGGAFVHAAYGFGEIEDETYRVLKLSELSDLLTEIILGDCKTP